MNVIFVAKNALDAYLINSAALRDVWTYLAPLAIKGEYRFFKILLDFKSLEPIITLSGKEKSLIASPSLKNSGFDATENLFF